MSVTVSTPTNSLMPQTMDQAARLAEMMSKGKLVPSHLQASPGDCLMVIEQAVRWGMSPFAVAQSTSVISGKLMFEGKLVAAALHTSGVLATRLDYQYSGTGNDRQLVVSALLVGEKEPRTVTVKLADAKTNNGMWTKQPDQQLAYHGARVWARRYAPEVMLGVYSPEEMESPPQPAYSGVTIDAQAETVTELKPKPTVKDWLAKLRAELNAATSREAVFAIVSREDVQKAFNTLKPPALNELEEMTQEADARYAVDGEPGSNG